MRIPALILLLLYVFSSTELHELGKLGNLAGHYLEHKSQNPEINFLSFLDIHYSSDTHQHDTADDETPLPFKSHHNTLAIAVPVKDFTHQPFNYIPHLTNFVKWSANYHNGSDRQPDSGIWQPPQFC